MTGDGYTGDWKSSFHLGNHLRLKFPLPEKERIDMGVWGGQLASLKFVRQPGRLVIKSGCFSLESEFCRAAGWRHW